MKIAIVGCGPAGLAAALFLQRSGHQITLFERFESARPVGSGIIVQPTGQAVLRELGLAQDVARLGSPINRILGIARPSGRVVLNVDYEALGRGFHGIGLHRAALFEVLYEAVLASEIDVQTGIDIQSVTTMPRYASVVASCGEIHGPFALVVDASGARSCLQQQAIRPPRRIELKYGAIWGSFAWPEGEFNRNALEQRYVGAHKMVGVLPIGRHAGVAEDQAAFFWSLKTSEYAAWLDGGLQHWKSEVRDIWPETESILERITDASQMTIARYGHATLAKPYGDRLVFIGDSAHSTSPQLGQGANMALLDAWSLAAALPGSRSVSAALKTYARSRWWHVRAFQLSSLVMTPFYQSDSAVLAALRDLLFDPVSKLPVARRIVAGLISGMLAGPPKDLSYDFDEEGGTPLA